MLAVTRHRVDPAQARQFLADAGSALAALQGRPGFRSARVGRALDDAQLWVLTTEWQDVGSYRRALSAYDVKVNAVPLLATAVDEPTAFEVLEERSGAGAVSTGASRRAADADDVGLGDAAQPVVPTDLDR